MIYFISLFFSLVFTIDSYTGRVIDDKGNALAGVNIELLGTDIGSVSDGQGYFIISFTDINKTGKITHIGYSDKIIDFDIQGKNDIVLQQASVNLDEIVVTGLRRKTYIKDVPVMTHVISSNDIEKSGATSIKELLEVAIPNVQNVMSSHAGISNNNIKIQGLDNRYMLFLVDGSRVSGEFAGNLDFNMLNLSNILRIEVIEGGMSSLYGSSAIGGVVNIITNRSTEKFNLEYSYTLDDPMITSQYFDLAFNYKKINYKLNLVEQKSDGYDLSPHSIDITYPLKTLEEYYSFSYGHSLEYFVNEFLKLNIKYKNYKNNVYQYQNHLVQVLDDQNSLYPFYYYTSYRFNMPLFGDDEYVFNMDYNKGKSRFKLKYHLDNYTKSNYFYNYTNLNCDDMDVNYFCNDPSNLDEREFINAENKNENILFHYDVEYSKDNYFTFGYEKNNNEYTSYNIYKHTGDNNNDGECGEGFPWDPEDCLVESIFGSVTDTKQYKQEAYFIGNQFYINNENIITMSLRDVKSENFGNDIVYSAAYLKKKNFYNYRLNFSSGFRVPAIKELYYDFQSHPPPVVGNPYLKSTSNNYVSFSVSKAIIDRSSSFEVYYNDVEDMIGISYSDSDGDGEDDILLYNNFNQVDISGFNFHYEYFNNKNEIKFVYNYTNPVSDNLEALELISKHSLKVRYSRSIIEDKLDILVNTKYSGEKFIVYDGSKMYLDDYFMTDLIFSLNISENTRLNFGCKNLFDYKDDRRNLDDDYLRDILTTYDPGQRYYAEFKVSFKND